MTLALAALLTCAAMIVLGLIPKPLSQLDMTILYFVDTILEISAFTVIELNSHAVEPSMKVEDSFALLVGHLITIPVLLLIVSNAVLYPNRVFKWAMAIGVLLWMLMGQQWMEWMGVVTFRQWNLGLSALLFCGFILTAILTTWVLKQVGSAEMSQS